MRTLAVISASIIGAVASGIAVAGAPPELDVRASCSAADRVSIAAPGTDKLHNDLHACLDDERIARGSLFEVWESFPAAFRTLCVSMNLTGGPPSYVELLTCLEVIRDASAAGVGVGLQAPVMVEGCGLEGLERVGGCADQHEKKRNYNKHHRIRAAPRSPASRSAPAGA
jgi:hypothetical protein